jgi:hypothetical protein
MKWWGRWGIHQLICPRSFITIYIYYKKKNIYIYKKYELSDNKHSSLEGFPNNACLLFAHAQTLTAADLLSPCACWYARNH